MCHCPICNNVDIGLYPENGFDFDNQDGGFWITAKCYSCGESFLVWCELKETCTGE